MKTKRPNLVLCMADQLRSSALGCYGNDFVQTPNLDRLAREGARFETAISPCPVCMPARSAVLAGQYARAANGTLGNVSVANDPTFMPEYPAFGPRHLPDVALPQLLRASGYKTGAIGKWHVQAWPDEIGFDHYTIPRVHHCHSAQTFVRDGGEEFAPDGWSVDFEADEAAAFFERQRDSDAPFFLYYNISPPHCPVADAPEKYLQMYDPAQVPIPPNVDLNAPLADQEHWFKVYRWDFRYYSFNLPHTRQLPEGYGLRELFAEYYGLTSWADDIVGRLRASLEKNGLWDDKIFVFTSDHGDNLGSHGLVQKGSFNDESCRVPLIVHRPNETPLVCREQVASLVDLAPTFLESAGAELPAHLQGQSLIPVLQNERDALELNYSFIEAKGWGIAVRSPRYLYALPWEDLSAPEAQREPAEKPFQFFDVENDPYQLDNLAGSSHAADVAAELDAVLRRWHRETKWMPTPQAPACAVVL